MRFVKLSKYILSKLKYQGYTTLHSVSSLNNENPTWFPFKDDISLLMDLNSDFISTLSQPLEEIHFLVIDDALLNIEEEDLIGEVFINDFDLL